MARSQAAIAELRRNIQTRSGTALFDFIREDIQERRHVQSDPRSLQVVMAGMEAGLRVTRLELERVLEGGR